MFDHLTPAETNALVWGVLACFAFIATFLGGLAWRMRMDDRTALAAAREARVQRALEPYHGAPLPKLVRVTPPATPPAQRVGRNPFEVRPPEFAHTRACISAAWAQARTALLMPGEERDRFRASTKATKCAEYAIAKMDSGEVACTCKS